MTELPKTVVLTRAEEVGWFVQIDGGQRIQAGLSDEYHLLLWLARRLGIKLVPEPLEHSPDLAAPPVVDDAGAVIRWPRIMSRRK
jgi:hypothetical protein